MTCTVLLQSISSNRAVEHTLITVPYRLHAELIIKRFEQQVLVSYVERVGLILLDDSVDSASTNNPAKE